MNQSPIQSPLSHNVDQGPDHEDQVLSAFNQDSGYPWSDLNGLVQAVDDKQKITVWPLDPPRVRERPDRLVVLGAGIRH